MPILTTEDGCKIYYMIQGSDTADRAIIFLNGTTQTTLYWGATVPAFSKKLQANLL